MLVVKHIKKYLLIASLFTVNSMFAQICSDFLDVASTITNYNSSTFSAGTVVYQFGEVKMIKGNDLVTNPSSPTIFDSVSVVNVPGRLSFKGKIIFDFNSINNSCKKFHLVYYADTLFVDGEKFVWGNDPMPFYIGDSIVIRSNNGIEVIGTFSQIAFESSTNNIAFLDGICYQECDGLESCSSDFDFDRNSGRSIEFKNQSSVSPQDADLFQWDFGDGNISYDENPNHIYDSEGEYDICLLVTRSSCLFEKTFQVCKSINIAKEASSNEELKITPDNDGQDDFVFVEAGSKIFDRYGKMVIRSVDNINWDGFDSDFQELPTGNYTVLKPNGQVFNVTIIR